MSNDEGNPNVQKPNRRVGSDCGSFGFRFFVFLRCIARDNRGRADGARFGNDFQMFGVTCERSEPIRSPGRYESERMKPSIYGGNKTCFDAIRLVCLALLLASANSHGVAGDGADSAITWLPLTQASPPSKIAELRRDILTFLEPLRRKLFGDPDVVLATAYFISVSPAAASRNVFPSATSTNADGTLACVLSAAQFSSYHQRILT